jgi:hypothetical protein
MMAVTLSQLTPQQYKPDKGSRFSSRKCIDDWLESLPLANMSAAGNELLAGLQELNHSRVSARFRLHALERLTEPVLAVVDALDKNFQETAFPLNEKSDKVGRVSVQFFRELSLGYRITVDQLAGATTDLNMINRKTGAVCVHRALSSLEQMLYRSSLLYQPVPQGVWSEIHTLYAFARQNGIHDRGFTDIVGWLKGKFSIDDIYKRVAIVGISDPSRLSQRGIGNVFRASELWSNRCDIIEGELLGSKISLLCFEINVDTDMPPQLMDQGAGENTPDFVFDVRRLKKWLKDVLEKSDDPLREIPFRIENREPLILGANLLQQLVNTWAVRLKRGFQRMPAQHEIKLIVGINGIHFNLAGGMTFEQFLDSTDNPSFVDKSEVVNNWLPSGDAPQSPSIYPAEVLNQSLGGYCLRLSELEDMHLRVGELVSVCVSSISPSDAIWMVGVVRWLCASGVDELEIGVSLIGQSARPVALLSHEEGGRKVPPFRGLMLNDFKSDNADERSLIVPGFFARNDAQAMMSYRDDLEVKVSAVSFDELIERSTEFCRYRFSGLEPADDQLLDHPSSVDNLDDGEQASTMSA